MSAQVSAVGVRGSKGQPQAGARAASAAGSRLEHERSPPCASAICRLSTSPMPVPLGLGGEERDEQVAGVGQPGPVVIHRHLDHAGCSARQPTLTPPAGLERGVGRVADQVDQQLVELVAVRA